MILESLKTICEAILVALDICGLPPVPFNSGRCLDRRKSKIIDNGRGSIYLDIACLPQMTRNVSEGQLLALRNVGKFKLYFTFIILLNTNEFKELKQYPI